jgi:uncharacterized protein YjbI with pentapeptide repeats
MPATPRRFAKATIPIIILLAVIAIGLVCVFVVPDRMVHKDLVRDGTQRTKLRNDVRSTLLQGLGGLLVLAGAYVAWNQLQVSRDQLQHNIDMSLNELHLNRQAQVIQRFSHAIEYLGNPRLDIQLGGIYALEAIALQSPPERSIVAQVLAAHARPQHDPPPRRDSQLGPGPLSPEKLAALAVLKVLGGSRLLFDDLPTRLELSGLDLRKVQIAGLSLRGANLSESDLMDSDLSESHLQRADMSRANLQGINLHGAHLEGSNLTSANLQVADLTDANLTGAKLADIDLESACLRNAVLDEANLIGAHLELAIFEDASLQGAHLDRANLFRAEMMANFRNARFRHADLRDANLTGANLSGADLALADLRGASLKAADLSGVSLGTTKLRGAICDRETRWPASFDPRHAGVKMVD